MADLRKITKLIEKLEILTKQLDRDKNIQLHNHINQFHYLEKTAELKILIDQHLTTEKKLNQLSDRLECEYKKVCYQWSKDIRWMNSIQRRELKSNS